MISPAPAPSPTTRPKTKPKQATVLSAVALLAASCTSATQVPMPIGLDAGEAAYVTFAPTDVDADSHGGY